MAKHPGARQAHNLWLGLQNLNGNLLCAVDVETTGLDINKHEIWQLAVLPLDHTLKPHKHFKLFDMMMKPESKEIDPGALNLNAKELGDLFLNELPSDKVQDVFVEWTENLGLAPGKKIIPVAHNWFFDRSFLIKWLGAPLYDSIFHPFARDTMTIGAFLNDQFEMTGREPPYTRLRLSNMCAKHSIVNEKPHNALADCVATAELYAALCREYVPL